MRLKVLNAGLLALLLCMPTIAHGACWQWSKTASANATADPTINYSVGMSPSSVSASGRAMMARLAECRDDLSGALTSTGTATAYTLATNQGNIAATPGDGQSLTFTVGTTNGAGVTLAVDSGTAFPIQTAPGTAASAGILIAGTPYTVKFSNSASAWILNGFYGSPFIVPIGAMLPYTGTSAPNSNFVLPAGQCISRTTYATYFALVGTTYGGCDGSTTFAVPDLRGKALYALDNLGGSAANVLTSTYAGASTTTQGTAIGTQSKTIAQTNLPAVQLSVTGSFSGGTSFQPLNSSGAGAPADAGPGVSGNPATMTVAGSITGTTSYLGSGTAISAVPPGMMMTFILRVL